MTEQIVEPSEAEVEAAYFEMMEWSEENRPFENEAVVKRALQAAAKVRAQQERGDESIRL